MLSRARHETEFYALCQCITLHLSATLERFLNQPDSDSLLTAIREVFDEAVVATHIQVHHKLKVSVSTVLRELHTLSEQSYENKALTFGCILDPNRADQKDQENQAKRSVVSRIRRMAGT